MTIANPNDEIGPIGAEVDEFLAPATTPPPPPAPDRAQGDEDDGGDRGDRSGGDDDEPTPVQAIALAIADRQYADVADAALDRVANRVPGPVRSALRGEWLGHALHPALTDFPLGCWMSASVLDLVGGRAARPAATRLVAVGLLGVPVVAAAGLVDWQPIDREREPRARRVGATHATANVVAAACYLLSWRARRAGRHGIGVTSAFVGAAVTVFSGYLGGELVFGVPERGDTGSS